VNRFRPPPPFTKDHDKHNMIPIDQSEPVPKEVDVRPSTPGETCLEASAELLAFLEVVGKDLAERWQAESSRGLNPSSDKTKPR
jgi:hypothetical protein